MSSQQTRVQDPGRLMALASIELVPGDPQRLLDQVARVATSVLSASLGASVITWNAVTEEYITAASTVPGQERRATASAVRRTGGATRKIIDSRERLIVADTTISENAGGALIQRFGVRSFAGVPIVARGEVRGVLYVLDSAPRIYDEDELLFMEALARRAASAIGMTQYIEELEVSAANHRETVAKERADRERADAVARVAHALMAVHEPEEDLHVVADGIGEALHAERVILVTLDTSKELVLNMVVGGTESDQIGPLDFRQLMAGLTGWAIRTGESVRSAGPDEREAASDRHMRLAEGSGPIVVVPMFFTDWLVGTLTVIRSAGKPEFSPPEAATIEVMASQAKLALERYRLLAATKQSLDETESLLETAVGLMKISDPAAMMQAVVEATATALPADMTELHLVNAGADLGEIRDAEVRTHVIAGRVRGVSDPSDGLLAATMAGVDGLLSDSVADPRESPRSRAVRVNRGIGPMALMPLCVRGEVLGVLVAGNLEGGATFDKHDLDLMAALTSMASVAISNAQLMAENKRLAQSDTLTALPNRRQLEMVGSRLFNSSLRYGHPLAALVIDLDDFKDVNDTFGHIIGDEVLKNVAEACSAGVRDADVVGRWGGDEFLALLPETDEAGAWATAQRIVESQRDPRVTLSIGVGTLRLDDTDIDQIIDRADVAMYAAKTTRGDVIA